MANTKNPESNDTRAVRVIVTDLDISFGNLIGLMLKVALAAIPAALILALVVGMVFVSLMAISSR
jgi:uncharacterized membrane protein (Fun14 family)